jgi:hypothetical protein
MRLGIRLRQHGAGELVGAAADRAELIRRRAAGAGIETKLGNRGFRATGVTAYLKNDGALEKAAARRTMLQRAPGSFTTAGANEVSLDEVERDLLSEHADPQQPPINSAWPSRWKSRPNNATVSTRDRAGLA